MTTVYFIRHAQADYSVQDDLARPLTEKGMSDRVIVTDFLRSRDIAAVYSSPYKRAVDTVSHFAEHAGLPVITVNDFRERKIGNAWIDNYLNFCEKQWADFSYKLEGGESIAEVQARNIAVLNDVLSAHKNENVAIGTHGTALSVIINYYDNSYGFEDCMAMLYIMPWVVKMTFKENMCIEIEEINILKS